MRLLAAAMGWVQEGGVGSFRYLMFEIFQNITKLIQYAHSKINAMV